MKKYQIGDNEIFEFEPCFRTVKILYLHPGTKESYYHLPIPYTIFVLRRENLDFSNLKTIHMGFRNKPLDPAKRLANQELLFPILPNILDRSLLVCCKPEIDFFWSSAFTGQGWPCLQLMQRLKLNFEAWQELSIPEILALCDQWPKSIQVWTDSNGLSSSTPIKLLTRIKLMATYKCRINQTMQRHIAGMSHA